MEERALIRIANCCNALTTRHYYMRDGRGSHMMPLAELADMFMDTYPYETEMMEVNGLNLRATLDLILECDILQGPWSFLLERRHAIERLPLWSELLDDPDDYHPRAYFFCVYLRHKNQQQQQQQQQQKPPVPLPHAEQWDTYLGEILEEQALAVLRRFQQVAEEYQQQQQQQRQQQQSDMQSSKIRRRLGLDEEVYDVYRNLLPPKVLENNHQMLKRVLNKMVSQRWWPGENYRIDEFGSTANGLLLGESDVDLTIVLPDFQTNSDWYIDQMKYVEQDRTYDSVFNLEHLAARLRKMGMKEVKVIYATVPICKFYYPHTNTYGDICVQNTLAIENSKLIKAYTRVDPRVRPFMYIVKHFARQRRINDSSRGTFSSYTYILMCLYYLMKLTNPVIPNLQQMSCSSPACEENMNKGKQAFLHRGGTAHLNVFYHTCINSTDGRRGNSRHNTPWQSNNTSSLSTLLIGFFDFYAKVGTERLILLNRYSRRTPKPKGNTLTVVDPFLESRNVAIASTEMGWARIRREFRRAANMLNNGGSFEQVLDEYRSIEYYDPDCIRNRLGFV